MQASVDALHAGKRGDNKMTVFKKCGNGQYRARRCRAVAARLNNLAAAGPELLSSSGFELGRSRTVRDDTGGRSARWRVSAWLQTLASASQEL